MCTSRCEPSRACLEMHMKPWLSATGRTAVVTPDGEFDMCKAAALREALLEACTASGVVLVLVDLGAVTFLDSTCIGVLVGASKRCAAAGRGFRLLNAHGMVLKVLTITGVRTLLQVDEATPLLVRDSATIS